MSFLLPYFMERPTIGNAPVNLKEEDEHTEENCSVALADNQAKQTSEVPDTSLPKRAKFTEAKTQPSASRNTHSITETLRKKPVQSSTSLETPSTELMKYILESKTNTNDIQKFFDSISTTVQSFPLRDRAIAKAKVFKVISQMEIEILGKDSSTYSEYASSPESI